MNRNIVQNLHKAIFKSTAKITKKEKIRKTYEKWITILQQFGNIICYKYCKCCQLNHDMLLIITQHTLILEILKYDQFLCLRIYKVWFVSQRQIEVIHLYTMC